MPEPIASVEENIEYFDESSLDGYECEGEIEEEEIFVDRTTPSYKCLVLPEISRSSIFFDKYYYFPEIEDPELDFALWGPDPVPEYDSIGIINYKELCKNEGIVPFRKVINSLPLDTLDLKFYGLRSSEMKAICGVIDTNITITTLLLEENYLSPESLSYLVLALELNNTITTLNLKKCQIGLEGSEVLSDIFMRNSSIEDLDLSFNSLGDDGFINIANGIRFNTSITKLNLSHNNLADEAFIACRGVMEDNFTIMDLNLSWNYLYKPKGMKELMEGLEQNARLEKLNMAWNGIGERETVRGILKYLKRGDEVKIKELDLSNNRFTGVAILMLYSGMKLNKSITTLKLRNNPLTPYEIEDFSRLLIIPDSNLQEIDFGDSWAKKSFVAVRTKIRKLNKTVSVGGIYSNYRIKGPNVQEVLLKRAKYVGMKQKKKKLRKDYGEWLLSIEEEQIEKDKFKDYIKKAKIKLDVDLIKMISEKFGKKNMLDFNKMKEVYMRLYPDTKAPEKKQKKKKGKKKKGKGKKRK